MLQTIITWMRDYDVGDFTGVAGILISIGGFLATLHGVRKSKDAASAAERAARDALSSIRLFETIVDFSAGIAILEEIKRLHRLDNAQYMLPDRYTALRKVLVQLKSGNQQLNDEQNAAIQNALVNLSLIEKQVEKSLMEDGSSLKPSKFNTILSEDIDGLLMVLTQLKLHATET